MALTRGAEPLALFTLVLVARNPYHDELPLPRCQRAAYCMPGQRIEGLQVRDGIGVVVGRDNRLAP